MLTFICDMKKLYFLLLALMTVSLFVGCGGDDNEEIDPNQSPENPEQQQPAVAITKLNFMQNRNPSMDRTFSFSPNA